MFVHIFVLGIIPQEHVATVVRDGRFSAHLLNNFTECVFMDEWTADSLSCDVAKRLLQGIRMNTY